MSALTGRERASAAPPSRTVTALTTTTGTDVHVSPASTGASPTGISVVRTKTTGATRVTGIVCSADSSPSVPSAAKPTITASHAATPGHDRSPSSSVISFVASPSQANASPAPTASKIPTERPRRTAMYGKQADGRERREDDQERAAGGVARRVLGGNPREAGHTRCDREHGRRLHPADLLSERAGAQHEQKDEPDRKRGLHDRQRRQGQGDGLQRPPAPSREIPSTQAGRRTSRRSSVSLTECSGPTLRASRAWNEIPTE